MELPSRSALHHLTRPGLAVAVGAMPVFRIGNLSYDGILAYHAAPSDAGKLLSELP